LLSRGGGILSTYGAFASKRPFENGVLIALLKTYGASFALFADSLYKIIACERERERDGGAYTEQDIKSPREPFNAYRLFLDTRFRDVGAFRRALRTPPLFSKENLQNSLGLSFSCTLAHPRQTHPQGGGGRVGAVGDGWPARLGAHRALWSLRGGVPWRVSVRVPGSRSNA
jgi:hypothetical protein